MYEASRGFEHMTDASRRFYEHITDASRRFYERMTKWRFPEVV